MNLVNGEVLDAKACDAVLDELERRLTATLEKGGLDPEIVLSACGRLVASLDESQYLEAMLSLGIDENLSRSYIAQARQLFSEESLRYRLKTELGENYHRQKTPLYKDYTVTEGIRPLGVLLHIAAGNADGLPAFSVLEGLLTGNVNILKLPSSEGGVSVRLLLELIKAEPLLAEYIYVFDYSSKDIVHIEKLVSCADAVVVWGGNEAVSALRARVPAYIKLIEWGHKISFAYVTEQGVTPEGLTGLAKNITATNQLLCSSLQGVFIDTDDMAAVYKFCEGFLPVLEQTWRESGVKNGMGIRSQIALQLYNEELEGIYRDSRVFKSENCSLIAYSDKVLENAIRFGNAWVRPLPHDALIKTLFPYKNLLQTVGLLCGESERPMLLEKLFKTGVVRVCPGELMSAPYACAPHDGEYPLRRYTKIVSFNR